MEGVGNVGVSEVDLKPEVKDLTILHVTDIHCAYDKIKQLLQWLKDSSSNIDVVCITGDVANVPAEFYNSALEELQKEHDEHLKNITKSFKSVAASVYFIPGNHDTVSQFNTNAKEEEEEEMFPINVHLKSINIALGLRLFGLGGSVPAFTEEGEQVWEGFPYVSDEKFKEDLSRLLDPVVMDESTHPEESYIIMTHNGPLCSSTTEVRAPPARTTLSGSKTLHSYLTDTKLQRHTVMNLHGHTHPSTGMASIGEIVVVNPGPLQEGHFGIYNLRLVPGRHPSWKIRSVSLHRLDN